MNCRCGCKTLVSEGKEFVRGHQTVYRSKVFRIADDPTHKLFDKAHKIIDERGWKNSYVRHQNVLTTKQTALEKKARRVRTKVLRAPKGVEPDDYAKARDLLDHYGIESGGLKPYEIKEIIEAESLDGVPLKEIGWVKA